MIKYPNGQVQFFIEKKLQLQGTSGITIKLYKIKSLLPRFAGSIFIYLYSANTYICSNCFKIFMS